MQQNSAEDRNAKEPIRLDYESYDKCLHEKRRKLIWRSDNVLDVVLVLVTATLCFTSVASLSVSTQQILAVLPLLSFLEALVVALWAHRNLKT